MSDRGKSKVTGCVGAPVYSSDVLCMWEKVEEWGDPSLPVLSSCSKLYMVLGIGALFNVGFVLVAEVGIIAGTRSGRS